MKALPKETSDEIFRLLDAGVSPGKISRRLGVSRNAVELRQSRNVEPSVPKRCPECGAIIKSPRCLACWLRSPKAKRGRFKARDFAVPVDDDDE